jgi:subtilisin family serine protease
MKSFKYGGKDGRKFNLVEAKDLVVVRTNEDADLRSMDLSESSRALAEGMLPVLSFPEANVTVYRVITTRGNDNVLKTRNAIRKSLNQEENVQFAGRTLVDQQTGEIVVYTENIFVKFKDEITEETCKEIIESLRLTIKDRYGFAKNAYFLQSGEGTGMKVFELAEKLLAMPEVETCHPELITEKQVKFIHPMQWHLHKTTISGREIDQHVQAEEAWLYTKGEGVTIAIIDNGVEAAHEAFSVAGKIAGQRNTLTRVNDARPVSPFSNNGNHGTACAGVACANASNGTKGVAPEAKVMALVCGSLGSMSEAVAFEWAVDNGADIISCSWGPPDGPWWLPSDPAHARSYMLPDSTRYALDYAATQGRGGKGCLIFWAAGNGNESVDLDGYAAHEKVIAVAACNDSGRRSIYSDYGNAIWCCFPSNDFGYTSLHHPKPLTPGIWTADISGSGGRNRGGTFGRVDPSEDTTGHYTATFGGTSSACPGAAGVAALILSINPDLKGEQVRDMLKNACDKIDSDFGNYNASGHSPFYGYGRLNSAKAVQLARETLSPKPTFGIEGTASFRIHGIVPLASDTWVGGYSGDADRLLGIQLLVNPPHQDIGIRYQIFSTGIQKIPAGADGQIVSQKDRRRKVTGLSMELTGALVEDYEVSYAIRLAGKESPAEGKNGTLCGEKGKGPAIEAISVSLC